MKIVLGELNKSYNSTKQLLVGTEIEVKLKESTSLKNPVFILTSDFINVKKFNAVRYGDFYYTIKDIVYVTNNICELHCELDKLATFKDYVKNSSGYMTYATSIKSYDLDDMRLTPTNFYRSDTVGSEYLLWDSVKNQNALMTTERLDDCSVSMQINNGVSDTISYVMRFTEFKSMIASLSDEIYANWEKVLKNIKYCTLLPIEWSYMQRIVEDAGSTAQTSIALGPHTITPCICYPIRDMRYIVSNKQMKVKLNLSYSELRFKSRNRWTKYQLILPTGVKEISFDDTFLPESSTNENYLSMRFTINVASGVCNLTIMNGAQSRVGDKWELPETGVGRVIAQEEWSIGSDLMGLVSITENTGSRLLNLATSSIGEAVNGGIAGATGGPVGSAIGVATSVVSNAFQTILKPLDIQQGNFSFSSVNAYQNHPIVGRVILKRTIFSCPQLTDGDYGFPGALKDIEKYYYDVFCSRFGYPVMRVIDLSKNNFTGFMQFDDVRFNFNYDYKVYATPEDLEYITQVMKNGIILQ